MLLRDAEIRAKALIKRWDIDYKFKFDNASTRFGSCDYKKKTIQLSRKLVKLNSYIEVKNTILHEIAHAITGPNHGHDLAWKSNCLRVGAKPERCFSASRVNMPKRKYLYTCTGCGCHWQTFRNLRNLKYRRHKLCPNARLRQSKIK